MELQADAEHQQDDANFRKLFRKPPVDDDARRVRSDERPGEQVADNRGQADALGNEAEQQRPTEAGGERNDQIEIVHRRR